MKYQVLFFYKNNFVLDIFKMLSANILVQHTHG